MALILTMQHFTHKEHPIILQDDPINPKYLCEGCMTYGYGQRYHCQACTFNLHEYCGTCPQFLSSFMHPEHPLVLIVRDHKCDRACNVCHDPIEGLSYRCELCEFNVHPICTQLPETLKHILHQAHPLRLLGTAEPEGTCGVCRGTCNTSSWRYKCTQCVFDMHIDCVPVQCQKTTSIHRGIPTYVPPPVSPQQQCLGGGYGYGIPYSHPSPNHFPGPSNMNHYNYDYNKPQLYQQHQGHPNPNPNPFLGPSNMNHYNYDYNKPQLYQQHQGHPNPNPSPFPGPSNMHHYNYYDNNKPQLYQQHQGHSNLNPNHFLAPSNMNHYDYNYANNPQLHQQPQGQGQVANTNNGESWGQAGRRFMFKLVKTIGSGVISNVIFGVDVSPFFT